MRLFYRARQLWVTVAVRPPPAALAAVPAVLSPPLMELFCGMQPGEQVHALRAGDVVFVKPDEVHQFRNTGDQPLKFLCLIPNTATGQPVTAVPECAAKPESCC